MPSYLHIFVIVFVCKDKSLITSQIVGGYTPRLINFFFINVGMHCHGMFTICVTWSRSERNEKREGGRSLVSMVPPSAFAVSRECCPLFILAMQLSLISAFQRNFGNHMYVNNRQTNRRTHLEFYVHPG